MPTVISDFLSALVSQVSVSILDILISTFVVIMGLNIAIWAVYFIYKKVVSLFWTSGVDDWGRPYYHNKLTGHGWDAHGEY